MPIEYPFLVVAQDPEEGYKEDLLPISIAVNQAQFKDLAEAKDLAKEWANQYPIVSVSNIRTLKKILEYRDGKLSR